MSNEEQVAVAEQKPESGAKPCWYESPGSAGKPGKTRDASGRRLRRRLDPAVVEGAMRQIAGREGGIGGKWPKKLPKPAGTYSAAVLEGFDCNGNPAAEPDKPHCTQTGVHARHHVKGLADDLLDWLREDVGHFLFIDWCVSRGIANQNIQMFCDRSPCFARVYELARDVQRARLLHGGLEGVLTERLTILILVNEHGYTDGTKEMNLNVNAPPRLPATVEETEKAIAQLQDHRNDLNRVLAQAAELGRQALFVEG